MIAEYARTHTFRPTIEQAAILDKMEKKTAYIREALQEKMLKDGLIKEEKK